MSGLPKEADFYLRPPSLEHKIQELLYFRNVWGLGRECFWHFRELLETLENQLGKPPQIEEILPSLDDGHQAWLKEWRRIQNHPEWDINRQFKEWGNWYEKWQPWFAEHHPSYLLAETVNTQG